MLSFRPGTSRLFVLLSVIVAALFVFSTVAAAQQPTCSPNSTAPAVHAEGLAERIGDITLSCTGGNPGSNVSLTLFVSLNTNITNRLDDNQQPTGIIITGASGSVRASGATLNFSPLTYAVPVPAAPVTITISGIRAAVAAVLGNSPVTATVLGIGATFPPNFTLIVTSPSSPTLLSSVLNNGVPCNGSPLPTTLDFATFSSTSVSSTVRITEASAAAFTPKDSGADNGLRIVVSLTGYGSAARVFVPDFIAGNTGSIPTSAGAFGSGIAPGIYTPSANQLLLVRVTGATSAGAGGTVPAKPGVATPFASVTEVPLTNGYATVTYEVVDSNANVVESAQIPVFAVVSSTNCPSTLTPQLSATVGPVSTVSTASASTDDSVPRYVAATPGPDCGVIGDCTASYYPKLMVDQTPLVLTGTSKGGPQSSFVPISNLGSGILNFTTSIAYDEAAANWLSLSPSSGSNNVTMQVIADPTTLAQGTYTAAITVNAGLYGTASIPVTFNVGAVGVVVQNVGNGASFQYGTVAPGSYAVLYGLNLAGTNVGVTFNGLAATIVYKNATQINLVVPTALGTQQAAAVVVTVDGVVSNSFRTSLTLNSPGIFTPGLVNYDDNSINDARHPAARGSFVIVFFTGLTIPLTGQVTVNIGGQTNLIPAFAGAQPTLPALDQVNILLPASMPATTSPVPIQVCIPGSTGQQVCSNAVNLYVK
jgi:uncharacterized protein (TIGR03437 family)